MANEKHTILLGLNHRSSKTDVRDRLLFPESALVPALERLSKVEGIQECVIISTCNRVEVYAVAPEAGAGREALIEFLASYHKIDREEFEQHAYFHHCEEAVNHLFMVACSLDSLVIGEMQILGQLKEAFRIAQTEKRTGPVFNKLFQFAVTAGKRARAETHICDGAVSVSVVAVELARKTLGQLEERSALIIGAGEMSELTARHLRDAGVGKLFFANRSLERAVDLAAQFGGTPLPLDDRRRIMAECDIVISSTASPHYIITAAEMREVMAQRKNRSVLLIDIAAPRDIHPDVGKLYNVFLFTIDDLASVAKINTEKRAGEVANVQRIIDEESAEYYKWYGYLKVQPTLQQLRKRFETIREQQLGTIAAELGALPRPAQELIRSFAQKLTDEYLQTPSKNLRLLSETSEGLRASDALNRLFELE
jgi:glutamyl-tRNA reductase